MYKRVLLKLSGEALQGKDGSGFDQEILESLANQIKEISSDYQIAIVIGGGNFVRGKFAQQMGIERTQVDYMGMLATVINSLAVQSALESKGIETRVQSAIPMDKVCEPYILRRAIRHLEKGRVVIFAAGTGNPYFSTDTAAALRASEIKADVILMAKSGVDGVYDADPKIEKAAKKYDKISYMDIINHDLQVLDSTAASICQDNDMKMIVFDINTYGNIKRALINEKIGTEVFKEEKK